MTKRTVELSFDTRNDFKSIWDHGVAQWSPARAATYYGTLADRIEALASGDLIGFPVLTYPGLLRSPIGVHVIYFRLTTAHLQVARILHHSMELDRRL